MVGINFTTTKIDPRSRERQPASESGEPGVWVLSLIHSGWIPQALKTTRYKEVAAPCTREFLTGNSLH